jgi:O-antigen/teichoic acid export membrane protein
MRQTKVIRSIVGSALFKVISSVISFITIPLLLKELGTSQYAVWATTTALLGWVSLFDFGVGYSLKNKTTEALAIDGKSELVPVLTGTLQFYLVSACLLLIIFILSLFTVSVFKDHKLLAIVTYVPVIVAFPFSIGNFLLQAMSKFNFLNLIMLLQNFIWMAVILTINYFINNVELHVFAIIFSSLYFFVNLTYYIVARKNLGLIINPFKNWKYLVQEKKSIIIGSRFFLLQLSSLFLYSIGNILAYDNMNLSSVAQYDISSKIYILGMTIFNIVISVFWTEISKAKASNDGQKLSRIRKQLLRIGLLFSLLMFVTIPIVPVFIKIWTRNQIDVNVKYLFAFATLVSTQAIAYCGAVFLNAFEQLKGQVAFSIVASLLMIPLSVFLFRSGFSIASVPVSSSILTFPTMIYVLLRSGKIIKKV